VADEDIFKACRHRGARCLYHSTCARSVGNHKALRAVGLPGIVDLGEAHTIARIPYGAMRAENQAAGVANGDAADA
jgi:hypothetical protein